MEEIDAICGLHVETSMETGCIGACSGAAMATSHPIIIEFFGRTSHASKPQQGVDALAMAVRCYMDLQMLLAHERDPLADECVLCIGSLHAGTTTNVTPDYAEIKISFRNFDMEFDERMLRRIRALAQAGQKLGRCAKVHLKLDTGMNRIGVRTAEEAQALTRLIDSLPGVALTGCFTHMATADEPDPTGTLRQIERFEALCKAVKAVHPGEIICHGANTASIFRYPQLHADMVRGGLALYGYPPVPEATGLQPAMRWVTRGIYVKTIAPGDRVSYGGTFVATRPTVVMTLPVGYADGYRRGISGKGCVLVRGRRAPILGRVCMDQMMVDVTDIPGAQEGDEAVLLGRQGDEQIDAEEMAAWLDTISYEVLCSPSKRVPRVYINA